MPLYKDSYSESPPPLPALVQLLRDLLQIPEFKLLLSSRKYGFTFPLGGFAKSLGNNTNNLSIE